MTTQTENTIRAQGARRNNHQKLVGDCKPTNQIENRARELYFHQEDGTLFSQRFFVGFNEQGIGFEVIFKRDALQIRTRVVLTPTEQKGAVKHKHLSRWFWMYEEHRKKPQFQLRKRKL